MVTLIFVIQDNELMGIEIITWNVCVKMTGLNFIWNYRKYRRSAKQKTFKSHAHWRPKLIENEIKSKIMNEWEKRLTFYDNLWSTTIKIKTMFFFVLSSSLYMQILNFVCVTVLIQFHLFAQLLDRVQTEICTSVHITLKFHRLFVLDSTMWSHFWLEFQML